MHPPATAGLLVALAMSAPAYAVQKCLDAKGRTVFSDVPCVSTGPAAPLVQPTRPTDPEAQPIPLPLLTAGQGAPRELVTALFRCLEAASVASQTQFLACSVPGGAAHTQAGGQWPALLNGWRRALPRRLLATGGSVDKTERFGTIGLVSAEPDQLHVRMSASFARHQGLWKLVQLQAPPGTP